MTCDEFIALGTIMDATRLAAVCAEIDDKHSTMSGNRVAAICAMIEDGAAARKHRRKTRRRRLCVDSTSSYRQIATIGSGGFGAVIKARHRKTGHIVAIKKLFPRRDRDDGEKEAHAVRDVLREACFLAACAGHPNLVGLHTVARDPRTGEYSVVMEYVGPTLHDALTERLRLHDGAAFPEAHVRRVIKQILTGAEAMHSRGIVHRDIKTGNVLVVEEGEGDGGVGGGGVKICDFGLAVTAAAAKSGGPMTPYRWAGTVAYMAPEVLMCKWGYDEGVDLWSVGCVMAELLSGEVLFSDSEVGGHHAHQIDRIFDLVGTPPKKTFRTFMSPFMARRVRRRRAEQQPRRPCRLRERFPSDVLSQDGYDVLKGLLTCNPNKRLTAAKALQLPWFTSTDTVGVPASESEVGVSTTEEEEATQTALPVVMVLTSVWAFLRKMALPICH